MTPTDPASFQRSVRVPDTVDADKVEASFDNGVLKVRLPKRPEAIGKQRPIPIKKAQGQRSLVPR
jgi:HSP20 family protein